VLRAESGIAKHQKSANVTPLYFRIYQIAKHGKSGDCS
jgi:hypothetical protein